MITIIHGHLEPQKVTSVLPAWQRIRSNKVEHFAAGVGHAPVVQRLAGTSALLRRTPSLGAKASIIGIGLESGERIENDETVKTG
ncbi:hypothetical protein EVAR_90369_1 [Eumeta japonica]|uniref:Uncharacterized protein n=1 Tax=Eumeta variegata TaxID=151549 RepID=A0A4C1Y8B6_EUMVA|nr:hypothetical protein EVAR_90369_1 [Eumeta japonica]